MWSRHRVWRNPMATERRPIAEEGMESSRTARTKLRHGRGDLVRDTEIERLRGRLIAVEREKASIEAFAAVAAHELLQPLILTEACAEIVGERLDGPEHEDSRQELSILAHSARRTRLLVETILTRARVDGSIVDRRPVDLNAVVRNSLAPLESEFHLRRAIIEVTELPTVNGDEPLIASIYTNLLINGLKFSPRESTIIRVGCNGTEGETELFVESNAPTIPAEDRTLIFEAYHRGRNERRVRGIGLGLAICKAMVEHHGGRIWVAPGADGGNRFSFTLPD